MSSLGFKDKRLKLFKTPIDVAPFDVIAVWHGPQRTAHIAGYAHAWQRWLGRHKRKSRAESCDQYATFSESDVRLWPPAPRPGFRSWKDELRPRRRARSTWIFALIVARVLGCRARTDPKKRARADRYAGTSDRPSTRVIPRTHYTPRFPRTSASLTDNQPSRWREVSRDQKACAQQ